MTAVSAPLTILKSLTALRLDINIWSGCRKLTPTDLASTRLPPERLASLGSKKVCNPEALRIFTTLKSRAVALLDRHGVRFLGGWALPDAHVPELLKALNRLADEFTAAKDKFLTSYDESISAWIADNPGWEDLIARSLVRKDVVRSRLHFSWQMFKVAPPRRAGVGHSLVQTVQGLGQTLLADVAKGATDLWERSYAGKTEVSLKALQPLRLLHQKMAGLHFLEPRILPVVTMMEDALAQLPEKGPLRGSDLLSVQELLSLLRDPDTVLQHGQALLDGDEPPHTVLKVPDCVSAAPCRDSLGLW